MWQPDKFSELDMKVLKGLALGALGALGALVSFWNKFL